MVPKDLRFTKTHEWAKVEETSNLVVVGISDFAAGQLGDIVYVELPEAGQTVALEDAFGVIESVKAAVELYSPVSGEVVEVNQAVADDLDLVSKDPYGGAWMIKVRADDSGALDGLMTAADYEAYVKSAECEQE